jgi:glycosyltransferase involved in cell wall biosynthesis
VERFYGLPAERIRVIRNAVGLEPYDHEEARSFVRRHLGVPPEQKLVVKVAHLSAQKNYPMFVRTAARVCREREDVTFVSVGSGSLEQEMTDLAASLGVAEQVRFLGERRDAHRWLAGADLFCFTTDFEGFPNALLEAMMSGLPVATTCFAGIEELTGGREIAVTVPVGDDEAMAREIGSLLDDSARRKRLGAAAREWVSTQYPWDALVRTMESFYEGVVERRIAPNESVR